MFKYAQICEYKVMHLSEFSIHLYGCIYQPPLDIKRNRLQDRDIKPVKPDYQKIVKI